MTDRTEWFALQEFDLRLYSASDLQDLLRSVGFTETAA